MTSRPSTSATEPRISSGAAKDGYRYLSLGSAFARADMPFVTLSRRVWQQRHRFLGDEGKQLVRRNGVRRIVPEAVFDLGRVARMLLRFQLARVGARQGEVLDLPVRGDVAIERRSGARKVLDLERERVYTLMSDPAQARKLRERIAYARKVEGYPFAPALHDVQPERGFFAETYLHGTRPRNFRGCFEGFESSYLGLLVDFARAKPPRRRPVAEHGGALRHAILAPDGLARRLPAEAFDRVRLRVEASAAIVEAADGTVPLTLSHGDFFSGNIVVGDADVQAIDWAHVGCRSPLHDLYYLAMAHCVRVFEPRALHARFHEMREMLLAALRAVDPARADELAPWLAGDAVSRHLFYLECIEVPLTRCDDPNDRYIRAMLQRVEWFGAFEAVLGEDDGAGSVTDQGVRHRV